MMNTQYIKVICIFWSVVGMCSIVIAQDKISSPAESGCDYYLMYKPASNKIHTALIMLPGMGESSEGVAVETEMGMVAMNAGIVALIPSLKGGKTSLGVESSIIDMLSKFIRHVKSTYEVDRILLVGFSAGGALAVKYTEVSVGDSLERPRAIVAIDPPLDFERLHATLKRNIRLAPADKVPQAAVYLSGMIESIFEGTPEKNRMNYYRLSPYSLNDTTQRAIKSLKDVPIMIINEPDIDYAINTYGHDYYSMNVIDAAAMINELRRLGNQRAVLAISQRKGENKQFNRRTTHAWSIADPEMVVAWLLKQME